MRFSKTSRLGQTLIHQPLTWTLKTYSASGGGVPVMVDPAIADALQQVGSFAACIVVFPTRIGFYLEGAPATEACADRLDRAVAFAAAVNASTACREPASTTA